MLESDNIVKRDDQFVHSGRFNHRRFEHEENDIHTDLALKPVKTPHLSYAVRGFEERNDVSMLSFGDNWQLDCHLINNKGISLAVPWSSSMLWSSMLVYVAYLPFVLYLYCMSSY